MTKVRSLKQWTNPPPNLEEELKELAEDKKATIAERVNYKKAIDATYHVLNKFRSRNISQRNPRN